MPPAEESAAATAAPTLSGLVGSPPSRPLVPTPLPAAASATGELVAGFPQALRPLGGSEVTASSLSTQGPRLQVALEATTSRSVARVLRGYRLRLARHTMAEEPVAAVGGARATAFRRGPSSLVVTVLRVGDRTAYTVSGVLHADRS